MKKLAVVSLILMLGSTVFAQPSYVGTRGLFRTISADNQGRNFISLSVHANYFQENVSGVVKSSFRKSAKLGIRTGEHKVSR